ncbi:hypothetical protein Cfor_05792 [Coptotermes formosanus]|uniref:Uncharacterized protein n=1 Tax=Coptotermes formosanus TaxID=36987 RepID=A0A6L2Q0S6_COPFO|nr:hypothetical protein Cfor_05792 [Coptotermes formosanus]
MKSPILRLPEFQKTLDIDQKMIEVPESRLHIEISQFGYLVFIGFEVDEGWVEDSDTIERLHISASEAFNKFKGKTLDGKGIDFSDRLSKRLRTGYDARSGDWELAESGEKETPLQKYQRLQCEMRELLEEITQLKERAKDEKDLEKMSSVLLSSQVEVAKKQLAEVRLEETLGTEVMASLADPQGSQLR